MHTISEAAILSTSYLPNIQYLTKFLLHSEVIIDIHETYLKQSFRNRCQVLSANGLLDLSIPVIKPYGNRTITKDIQIEYVTNWQQTHWRAIVSAYNNSPFFEFFEPELAPLFEKEEKFLIDFNTKALYQLFKCLDISFEIKTSTSYFQKNLTKYDYRDSIHPKKRLNKPDIFFSPVNYYQLFTSKNNFIRNLSFIDLMFNEGPQAIDICTRSISVPDH